MESAHPFRLSQKKAMSAKGAQKPTKQSFGHIFELI